MSSTCSVCNGSKTSFNYGVLCCNACKMFFRRAVISPRPKVCKTNGNCSKTDNRACRLCRYQWCLQAGMHIHNLQIFKNPESDSDISALSLFISHLSYLDEHRKQLFYNCEIVGDPFLSLDNAISGPVNFIRKRSLITTDKPSDKPWTCQEWDILDHITCIDFLKKMEFMALLSVTDQSLLIREFSYKFKFFASAMRSFSDEKIDKITFPGGIDIFVPEVLETPSYSPTLLQNIRCLIIAKLIELKVKNEEFLMVAVLFFCYPGVPSLSSSAQVHITRYQRIYTSALFQYCLINYQNGPSRFNDLLSLITVINATWTDITAFVTLFRLNQEDVKLKCILEELMDVFEEGQ